MASWPIEHDLYLLMACPPRPRERDIRSLAGALRLSRAQVRRRRRALRRTLRRAAGRGGRG